MSLIPQNTALGGNGRNNSGSKMIITNYKGGMVLLTWQVIVVNFFPNIKIWVFMEFPKIQKVR